jgi:hypothetical protein
MGVDGEWIYPGASYPFVLAYVSNHPYRAAEGWIRRRSDGRWLLFFDAVLLESHVRNKRLLPKPFPVFRREVSLEALDMRLTYAIAAPESAPLRFEGPFELSRPVAGAPGSAMRLAAIDPPDKERSLDGAVFEVYGAGQVGLGFAHSPDAFAIDDRGGVHRLAVDFFAGQVDARTSPGLPATHYIAPGVGRGRIRRIVAGGAWRRKTFHNLPTFVFPNKEQRRDAEARDYLEAFGRIFGEEKTPTPQTNAMILLSTREEAIELAAIARSAHIPLLVERLAGFSLEDLRPAQRRTLIDALLRWTDSGDPLARLHGLKLGAQLKAPEIFEPALQWIFEPVWNEADWMDAGLRLAEKRAREATRPISRREFQAFESQFGNPAFGSRRWNPAYWRLRARWEAPILLEEAFPQFTPEQVGLIKGAIEKTNDSLTEERLKLMLERRGR